MLSEQTLSVELVRRGDDVRRPVRSVGRPVHVHRDERRRARVPLARPGGEDPADRRASADLRRNDVRHVAARAGRRVAEAELEVLLGDLLLGQRDRRSGNGLSIRAARRARECEQDHDGEGARAKPLRVWRTSHLLARGTGRPPPRKAAVKRSSSFPHPPRGCPPLSEMSTRPMQTSPQRTSPSETQRDVMGDRGFEPRTSALSERRSNRLS